MSTPVISVVMPAYNHEIYVGEAIESVLNQSFKDFELIVIDDGSTDNTAKVINSYHDDRLIYHYQSNQDAFNALNNAMAMTKGHFISIINSDDVYLENRLETLVNRQKVSNAHCLFSDLVLIDDKSDAIVDKDFWWIAWHLDNVAYYHQYQDLYAAFLHANIMVTTSNLFMSRQAYQTVGNFKPLRYLHDYDYIFRLLNAFPDEVEYVHDAQLVKYRLHGSNTLSEAAVVGREQDLEIIRENLFKKCPGELHDYLNIGIDRLITLEHELVQARSEFEAGKAEQAQRSSASVGGESQPGVVKRLLGRLLR